MATDKMADLHSTLSGKPKQLKWGSEQQASFQLVKNSLTVATELVYSLPGDTLIMTTDASDKAIGAVLQTYTVICHYLSVSTVDHYMYLNITIAHLIVSF